VPDGPLVSSDELVALLADGSDVVAADVRWYLDGRSGRAAYEAGHIPGAVFVDLDRDLAAPPDGGNGRRPLPDPATFAAAMSRLGIGRSTLVVAYDDAGGSVAARLWWMLRAQGGRAAVLDGGLQAWTGPLEAAPGHPRRSAAFDPQPWPADRLADAELVAAGRLAVIDARAPERYRGEIEPIDARPGHVPGAINRPWADNLGPDGRFRPADELRAQFGAVEEAVVYCGSGVTACHDLLALEVAGLGDRARLYPGSWSEWSADPTRPVATGDEAPS
jgi:thiosulfate/3-mercaptopyruvate sulfurtransferase